MRPDGAVALPLSLAVISEDPTLPLGRRLWGQKRGLKNKHPPPGTLTDFSNKHHVYHFL